MITLIKEGGPFSLIGVIKEGVYTFPSSSFTSLTTKIEDMDDKGPWSTTSTAIRRNERGRRSRGEGSEELVHGRDVGNKEGGAEPLG